MRAATRMRTDFFSTPLAYPTRQHPLFSVPALLLIQLAVLSDTAVHVCGVGTATFNSYLLPPGAVAINLGWRHPKARNGIVYFDHHILGSLDHVSALRKGRSDIQNEPPRGTGGQSSSKRLKLACGAARFATHYLSLWK